VFTTRHAISPDFTWPNQRQVADLFYAFNNRGIEPTFLKGGA
jgi:hypothetical protein